MVASGKRRWKTPRDFDLGLRMNQNRAVVHLQRRRDLAAAPPIVQQHDRVGAA
jgi:hypothetical protein